MRPRGRELTHPSSGLADGPIDEEEQQKIVTQLETEAAEQDTTWRRVFAVLAIVLALAYAYLGLRQVLHPWDMRHHAVFAGVVPAMMVAALELASGVCMAASGISVLPGGRERAQQLAPGRWLATVRKWPTRLALLNALAWCPALFWARQGGNTQQVWHYAWLPLGPLAFEMLVAQVDAWLSASFKGVAQLRNHMYAFKEL